MTPCTRPGQCTRALAAELAGLAGGSRALADRALALVAKFRAGTSAGPSSGAYGAPARAEEALRLAGHLAELFRSAAQESVAEE